MAISKSQWHRCAFSNFAGVAAIAVCWNCVLAALSARAMDVTKPFKFTGIGAMDVTKPYNFMGLGAMNVTKPYKFIGFGAVDEGAVSGSVFPHRRAVYFDSCYTSL